MLKDPECALSFRAKLLFYNAHIIYNEATRNDINSVAYRMDLIKLFETYPQFVTEESENYLSALNNLLIGLKNTGDNDEFLKWLETLLGHDSVSQIEIMAFSRSYTLELEFRLLHKTYAKALELVIPIEDGFTRFGNGLTTIHYCSMCLQISFCFLMENQPRQALKWINRVIQVKIVSHREDIYYSARILNILVHFESDNYDYLKYDIDSTYKLLSKKDVLFGYEKIIITSFRSYIDKDDISKKQFFLQLKDQLEAYKIENNIMQNPLYNVEIIDWIDHHLNTL